jgi:hypothetical protein
MTHSPNLPTLDFYARAGCEMCDEARLDLQVALEQRVLRGDPIVNIREVDISADPDLQSRYGPVIPVLSLNGLELTLANGNRSISLFLDRALGRAA